MTIDKLTAIGRLGEEFTATDGVIRVSSEHVLGATLFGMSGLSVAANKLPYATGVDTFEVCDFTSLGRSLIGETTAPAVRNLIAAASSTTATQDIYVDSAATGAGTGVDWTNAFTSWQAAVNSLPAIINHAVIIYGRNGTYAENVTIQRVVAAGSITLRGEYYWYGTNASSKTGKFDLGSSDFGYADRAQIAAGDVVWATKWSGTVNASTPSESIIDTVASVSGAEITLTTNTTQEFDTTWTYQIVKTRISPASGSGVYINSTTGVTVNGIGISTGATGWSYPVRVSSGSAELNYCYVSAVNNVVAGVSLSNMSGCTFTKCAIIVDACSSTPLRLESKSMITFQNSIISAHAAVVGAFASMEESYGFIYRSHIMDAPVGLYAQSGGIVRYSVTLNEATTPMNPATSPGNYNGYIGTW